jgi:glutamate racemase
MSSDYKPIGVFDSGYGGLTILKELKKRLPQYDYLYLGDNARTPYGSRSFDVVYEFTLEAVKELFDRGCELIILACNTASAKALRTIQQEYLPTLNQPNKRVLGVIRPSVEVISSITKTNHIGVLATPGTVKSESYPIEIHKIDSSIVVTQQACPIWVPLIENNLYDSIPGKSFIQNDVHQLLQNDQEIDAIILGCTHYPLIKEYIQSIVDSHIQVIAQGAIVAEKLEEYLKRHTSIEALCSKGETVNYLTTENALDFDVQASKFMKQTIKSKHIKLS